MRGDRPLTPAQYGKVWEFTPHARGSTVVPAKLLSDLPVYPACAGIDLTMGYL